MVRLISSGGVPVDVLEEKVERLLAHGFTRAPQSDQSAPAPARKRIPRRRPAAAEEK